ncbi:peptide deformylase [Longibacter salinarum]|uniref:Peptide deformylase n=1 Tax=Longibacter salinarum TaxID=1850348 RepID=A0A2A8D0E5_9BACT|nr:peptide deformylase [Longibacter salinarum]PEN14432.1 peptide deformylase [Longibacter salinarum]
MVLPIYTFGHEKLREETEPVEENSEELQSLIDDMVDTMYAAAGIGLAAPQVGRGERLFVIDVTPMADEIREEGQEIPPQPMVFINPEIVAESEVTCDYEEGCLSIPDVRETVTRPEAVRIRYLDRDFEQREREVSSFLARVIQHEFDHLFGVLFTDYLGSFRKRMVRRSLRKIADGEVEANYPLVTAEGERV